MENTHNNDEGQMQENLCSLCAETGIKPMKYYHDVKIMNYFMSKS